MSFPPLYWCSRPLVILPPRALARLLTGYPSRLSYRGTRPPQVLSGTRGAKVLPAGCLARQGF